MSFKRTVEESLLHQEELCQAFSFSVFRDSKEAELRVIQPRPRHSAQQDSTTSVDDCIFLPTSLLAKILTLHIDV